MEPGIIIDELFKAKSEYNKWLLELSESEVDLIKEMMYEAMKQGFSNGQSVMTHY